MQVFSQMDEEESEKHFRNSSTYAIESWIYGVGVILGAIAVWVTARRLYGQRKNNLVIAARLMSYKISLTAADLIILFIYAPTQFIWIKTYYWYGGDFMCRTYKFITMFGFHLTANMQVLIALDRLYITTRLNHVNNTRKNSGNGRFSGYRQNAYIMFAYLLAFSCAIPQLFVFQMTHLESGETQCTSIWTLARTIYYKTKANLMNDALENVTSALPLSTYSHDLDNVAEICARFNISIPAEVVRLEKDYYQFMIIEQIYNVFHLASLCVLPYLIELLCYASILYLLKGAKRGQFLNIKDITKMRWQWCALPPFFRKFKNRKTQICLDTERTDVPEDETARIRPTRTPIEEEDKETKSTLFGSEEASIRRSSLLISSDGRSTISDCATVPLVSTNHLGAENHRLTHSTSPGLLLSVQNVLYKYGRGSVAAPEAMKRPSWYKNLNQKRRASCPETTIHKDVKPWMNTVAIARKKTRKKAFYMLTLNLIFWAPYCILGIVSAITVYHDFHQFLFVSALLVFNAITNILL